ncbi:MAG: hypothetical protein U1E65_10215 [Myxococcota bacterium]
MVKLGLVLLAVLALEKPAFAEGDPLGVAGVVRGNVSLLSGAGSAPLAVGAVLRDGVTVETGSNGWVELYLTGSRRLRLSASTRLTLTASTASTASTARALRVELATGRISASVASRGAVATIVLGRIRAELEPGSAVIADANVAQTTMLEARVGSTQIRDGEGAALTIVPGQVALSAVGGGLEVRRGSGALANLAVSEARSSLYDPAGLRQFLLERVRSVRIGGLDVRTTGELLRLSPEILGADGGPTGAAVEEALRPPPFYDEEVPSKGPNVRVEVQFAGD